MASHEPTRRQFTRDGTELSLLDFGGHGAPVLLLHGLAGHAGEWGETASWLTGTNRVLALDQRGHGLSTRVPEDVSREAHVADVVEAIGLMGLGPVALVGQSLGANLAFLAAARNPEVVSRLVVAEGAPEADTAGAGARSIRRWLDGWPVPFASRRAAEEFFGGPALYARAWADGLEQREDGLWPRFDTEVMVRTLREGTAADHWEEWERVRCPALVVKAGEGIFPGPLLEEMAGRLAGARFVAIPGAGHDVHLHSPTAWRRTLAEFLGDETG